MAMFLADAPGVFVTQLTVGNGTAKSSASVTVTAVVGAPCSAIVAHDYIGKPQHGPAIGVSCH